MTSRVMIVDPIPARCTILRVMLLAVPYEVSAVDSCEAALATVKTARPDLIVLTSSALSGDCKTLCATLRDRADTRGIPVLILGGPDTTKARFHALDIGAEDIIPDPVSESLLLARIRSLLRRATVMRDLDRQADTLRFMGLREGRGTRIAPACVLLQSDSSSAARLAALLQAGLGQRVRTVPLCPAPENAARSIRPDLVVVDGTLGALDRSRLSAHLTDLRSRPASRQAAILVLLSAQDQDLAALAFDLGAHDVVRGAVDAPELGLRARRLLAQMMPRPEAGPSIPLPFERGAIPSRADPAPTEARWFS